MTAENFVSVVAPIFNPGSTLEPFVVDTVGVLQGSFRYFELILVDDGSTTLDVALLDRLLRANPGVRVLHLSREFGEDQAIAAGLDTAIGDFVITMSPGADPPALIPAMVATARDGADVVLGVRRTRRGDPWWLRAGAAVFHRYARRVLRFRLPKNATHFRCLSRQALNALNQLRSSNTRLRTFTTYIGFASQTFPYDQIATTRRSHTRTPLEALETALAMVVDNSAHPLRMVSALGVIAACLNFAYALYVVFVYVTRRNVEPGWVTLSLTNAAQFFFLSIILSVLCEYVGRLPSRLGGAPAYYVRDERVSSVLLMEERRNVVAEGGGGSERAVPCDDRA
jgi:glycosyltransferase involved in cell wall biosynthesis